MNPSVPIASSARLSHAMLTIVHAEHPTLDGLAAALADVAAGVLPGHDVAVTILVDRSRAARAATARAARELSALETRPGGGPTRRALDELRTVETGVGPGTGTGAGAWADAVAATGYRTVLAVPILAAGAATGAITLYGRTASGDWPDREVAELVAHQAALVVEGGRRLVQLRDAVASRDVIGQAKGILMHRFGIDAATAFRRLVEASQDMNVKLVDIAHWYVTDQDGRAPAARPS